jgi:hypothetical protein
MSQASEEDSSVMESSTSDSQTSGRDQQTKVSEESLAGSETRRVKRSKWLVSAVMFLAAAAVSISTYFFSRNEENNDFEAEVREQYLIDTRVSRSCKLRMEALTYSDFHFPTVPCICR